MGQTFGGGEYVGPDGGGNIIDSPVDIIFSTLSQAAPGSNSPNIFLTTGDVVDNADAPGDIRLRTGSRPDNSTGDIELIADVAIIGAGDPDVPGGNLLNAAITRLFDNTKTSFAPAIGPAAQTSDFVVKTRFSDFGNSGNLYLNSGEINAGFNGITGTVYVRSGPNDGPLASDGTGQVVIQSGISANGDSGNIEVSTGLAPNGQRGDVAFDGYQMTFSSDDFTTFVSTNLIDFDAAQIDMTASATLNLSGLNVVMNPSAGLDIDSSQIDIDSSGDLNIGAATRVQLNGPKTEFNTSVIDFLQNTSKNVVWEADTSVNRPATPVAYQQFFDTTLGTPIWYDGVNWIQADGTVV